MAANVYFFRDRRLRLNLLLNTSNPSEQIFSIPILNIQQEMCLSNLQVVLFFIHCTFHEHWQGVDDWTGEYGHDDGCECIKFRVADKRVASHSIGLLTTGIHYFLFEFAIPQFVFFCLNGSNGKMGVWIIICMKSILS